MKKNIILVNMGGIDMVMEQNELQWDKLLRIKSTGRDLYPENDPREKILIFEMG